MVSCLLSLRLLVLLFMGINCNRVAAGHMGWIYDGLTSIGVTVARGLWRYGEAVVDGEIPLRLVRAQLLRLWCSLAALLGSILALHSICNAQPSPAQRWQFDKENNF